MARKTKRKKVVPRYRKPKRGVSRKYNRNEPWFLGRDYSNTFTQLHQINKYNHAVNDMEQFKKYTGRENELKALIGKQKDSQDDLYQRVQQHTDKIESIARNHNQRAEERDKAQAERIGKVERELSRKSADDHARFDDLLREFKKSQSVTPPRATTPPTGGHPKASEAQEDAEIESINRLLGSARKLDRESPETTPQIPELPHDTLRSPVSEF
eukprot:SAG22_NODE_1153_length_5347_cov_16.898819_3_plen_212_part_01